MEMTDKTREEIKELICQTLDQREQKTAANKTVFRRVCADCERQLEQFDYKERCVYTNERGERIVGTNDNRFAPRLEVAISSLLRVAYKVDHTAKLPAEKEADIRRFMLSVLNLMAALRQ